MQIFRQQFKTFDPNNFTLSSMFSFQNVWPKKKALYMLWFNFIFGLVFFQTSLFFSNQFHFLKPAPFF